MEHRLFRHRLMGWYAKHRRDLPWRGTKDPYKVWLSEIILQQTRVNQGMPYYLRFIEAFYNVEAFAAAPLNDILRLWQGLGYYSRARNMHACAQEIVSQHDGKFPTTYGELQKLKGIGKYTAAAIASICFDEPVPTIDGNVFRLLSRVFGLSDDIAQSSTFRCFFDKATTFMPIEAPGEFNQAMMEYGAMVCTPKAVGCSSCVLSFSCFAYQNDQVHRLPVKIKKLKIKQRFFHYRVYLCAGQALIRQRGLTDIWAGLFEFHLMETSSSLNSDTFDAGKLIYTSHTPRYQLTHQRLHIRFEVYDMTDYIQFEALKNSHQMMAVAVADMINYAVPKPIEAFLEHQFLPLILNRN